MLASNKSETALRSKCEVLEARTDRLHSEVQALLSKDSSVRMELAEHCALSSLFESQLGEKSQLLQKYVGKVEAQESKLAILSAEINNCEDKLTVARARKIQRFLSQPFFVAEVFTGSPGKYVSLKDTISGFKGILAGEYDHLPEQAFYMVGGIEEAVEKAKNL